MGLHRWFFMALRRPGWYLLLRLFVAANSTPALRPAALEQGTCLMLSYKPSCTADRDRPLLFGVLALQADLLENGSRPAADAAEIGRPETKLAEVLSARGWLTPRGRQEIEDLLGQQLAGHGGNAQAGLAQLTSPFVHRVVRAITDPDLRNSLNGLASLVPPEASGPAAPAPAKPWRAWLRSRLLQRHRWVNMAATAVAVAVVGLAVGMLLFPDRLVRPPAPPPPALGQAAPEGATDQRPDEYVTPYVAALKMARHSWEQFNSDATIEALESKLPHLAAEEILPQTKEWDPRGFEWHYLWWQCQAQQMTLKGHKRSVSGVVFSPDGQHLASAGGDTVRTWEATTGRQVLTLTNRRTYFNSVAYSPDGRLLAAAQADGRVTVWEAAAGKLVRSFEAHNGEVTCVAFSHDSQTLASSGHDRLVKVWDVAMGKPLHTLKGHQGVVWCVAFSPTDQRLASAAGDGAVRVWEASTGSELLVFFGHTGNAYTLAFSPDGRFLASGGRDHLVKVWKVWDVTKSGVALVLKGHSDGVFGVAFSPDGRRLASAGRDGALKLWETTGGKEVLCLRTRSLTSVAFSPSGRSLAASSGDDTVKVWDSTLIPQEHIAERLAGRLVESLFMTYADKMDVIEQLKRDTTLSEPLRKEAVARAERHAEDHFRLNNLSWFVVREPNLKPAAYLHALREAEEACRQAPKNGYYLNTLGVAQYRVGRYAEALATLTRSDQINTAERGSHPADVSFLVMLHHRLGHLDKVQAELARLRELMQQRPWNRDEESLNFQREVEELLRPPRQESDRPAPPAVQRPTATLQ
jgi:hypothetical protein